MGAVSLAIEDWVHAVCRAATPAPADIAAAFDIDLTRARRVGAQLICPPPAGTDRLELVLDRATGAVSFAELTLAADRPLELLTAVFGAAQQAPRGPHDDAATMIFDRVWPAGAPRSCRVLARLRPGAAPLVMSVILYLHPAPADG